MMAYASRTKMRSALDAMTEHGWRQLIEPSHLSKHALRSSPPELQYMIDNGAWGCFNRGAEWSSDGFVELLELYGSGADMIVLPDIVAGGEASLGRSLSWLGRVRSYGSRMLLAVQDGMNPAHIEPVLKDTGCGIFVGGTTEWKLATLNQWGRVARRAGCWLHVARVNTVIRINQCAAAGANSFDGSSVTRWPVNITRLDAARRQVSMFGGV